MPPTQRCLNRACLHQGVLAEIEGWREHPELGKLTRRLNSMTDPNRFMDTYAECVLARRLVRHRCELCVEVQTPTGKHVDFKAARGDVQLYVHVKRLNLDDATRRLHQIARSTEVLEGVSHPVKFDAVVLGPEATDEEIGSFAQQLNAFGQHGQIGETLSLPNDDRPVLRVTIRPKGRSEHPKVNLSFPRYPGSWLCEDKRFREKPLSAAAKQLMPDSFNLIAVTSYWGADWKSFKEALDDFWSRDQHPESQAAVFFRLPMRDDEDDFESRLWLRLGAPPNPGTAELLKEIFTDQLDTGEGPDP